MADEKASEKIDDSSVIYEDIERNENDRRLHNILNTDPVHGKEKLVVFSARCALRVFPLLAVREDFNIWGKQYESPSEQAKCLLGVWWTIKAAWFYDENYKDIARHTSALLTQTENEQSSNDVDVLLRTKEAYDTINNVLDAAFFSASFSDKLDMIASSVINDTLRALRNAYTYIADVSNSDLLVERDLEPNCWHDLLLMEELMYTAQAIRWQPLWLHDKNDKETDNKIIDYIYQEKWKQAVDFLLEQKEIVEHPYLAENLKSMIDDYDDIYHGNYPYESLKQPERAPDPITQYDVFDKNLCEELSDNDFLGRERLTQALLRRLYVTNDEDHLTIGLFGDWGAGKSNFIKLLKNVIIKQRDDKKVNPGDIEYIYGEFNAWEYEHTDNIQAGMTQEVIGALMGDPSLGLTEDVEQKNKRVDTWIKKKKWLLWQKPRLILAFASALHGTRIVTGLISLLFITLGLIAIDAKWLWQEIFKDIPGLGAGVAGGFSIGIFWVFLKELKKVSAQPLAKELKTYLQLPKYGKHLGLIPVMAKEIKTLCELRLGKKRAQGKVVHRRLLFVIDDLDRCGIDGIVKTFEAIRLVLGLKNVVVIIAVDQNIALPALACHYEKLSHHRERQAKNIARDYLAKVINLAIHLPPPDDLSVAQYLAHLWNDPEFEKIEKDVFPKKEEKNKKEPNNEKKNISNHADDELEESISDVHKIPEFEEIVEGLNALDLIELFKRDNSELLKAEIIGEPSILEERGLSPKQKLAFYHWLLQFNLRNPRQIKRLYNSYNLIQHYYQEDHVVDDIIHGYPYMVALFVIEMVCQATISPDIFQSATAQSSKSENTTYLKRTADIRKQIMNTFFDENNEDILYSSQWANIVYRCLKIKEQHVKKAQAIFRSSNITDIHSKVEPFVMPASYDE